MSKKSSTDEKKNFQDFSAKFSAKYLNFLEPVMRPYSPEASLSIVRWTDFRGLHILPSAGGGIILLATNGHVLLIAHDPQGTMRSHEPTECMRLAIPDSIFNACQRIPDFELIEERELVPVPNSVPGWRQPGEVLCLEPCIMVMGEEEPPGETFPNGAVIAASGYAFSGDVFQDDEYRRLPDSKVDWRKFLAESVPPGESAKTSVTGIPLPIVSEAMNRAFMNDERCVGWHVFQPEEIEKPYVIRSENDEFVIVMMTGRTKPETIRPATKLPDWLTDSPNEALSEDLS